ncbi:MarR family winged helix-turn-helix transcriptional regulator [Alloacidobacterium sp.]|uniref:MarR family winged helix-turn-helix transcriptional regulator n=1 Tax=Alloacidobacterium sp. TaxID=2951999 RepID=UPI002D7028C9|nr:MarR family transcriptional regulator [Alloacidobacterium sp.]HYK36039.1 MarR family transcriptional regulator [Alloacidobacterium sp.]
MKIAAANSRTDTSGIHLWLVLWKAFRSVEAHAHRHIAGLGMCLSDFGVLEALLHKGPLTVNELGAKVLLTSGSMTAALDRLERRGMVERKEDDVDRRKRIIRLTQAGTALIRKAFEDHKRAMELAAGGVSRKDREVLIDLLRHLGLSADRNAVQPPNKSVGKRSRKE